MKLDKEFGFYPDPDLLPTAAGSIKISPLPDFDSIVNPVLTCGYIEDDWIYPPPQPLQDLVNDEVSKAPYSSRGFGLPKTHVLEHTEATGAEHIDFLIWALSFFVGMRLTAIEKGFFDATPVKPNKLVDFGLSLSHRVQAVELADRFWKKHQSEPRKAQLFVAAAHALFLGQYKQAQPVEEFIYLYTAIDACYRLTKELRSPNSRDEKHGRRINWMCCNLGVLTPNWACPDRRGRSEVSDIRNNTLHEALFLGAPLGYAGQWGGTHQNRTLEMRALVCRLLVALIGGKDPGYFGLPVDTAQQHLLKLS